MTKNFQLFLICNILSSSHNFFLWPHHVAGRVLVPWPGVKTVSPALQVQNFNHWTAREVLPSSYVSYLYKSHLENAFPPYQFSSVAQSCLTLCDPMGCSTPGFPVHHQLWELIQTHAIESVIPSNHLIVCHPLLLPPSIFPSIRVFSNKSILLIRWPKYWNFSFCHQSFQWIFRTDFL